MVVQKNEQNTPVIGVEVKGDSATRDKSQRAKDSQLMDSGGFDTTQDSHDRTNVGRIESVEVVHVQDGQVKPPDPNEVSQYDTDGSKKKKSCKEESDS